MSPIEDPAAHDSVVAVADGIDLPLVTIEHDRTIFALREQIIDNMSLFDGMDYHSNRAAWIALGELPTNPVQIATIGESPTIFAVIYHNAAHVRGRGEVATTIIGALENMLKVTQSWLCIKAKGHAASMDLGVMGACEPIVAKVPHTVAALTGDMSKFAVEAKDATTDDFSIAQNGNAAPSLYDHTWSSELCYNPNYKSSFQHDHGDRDSSLPNYQPRHDRHGYYVALAPMTHMLGRATSSIGI